MQICSFTKPKVVVSRGTFVTKRAGTPFWKFFFRRAQKGTASRNATTLLPNLTSRFAFRNVFEKRNNAGSKTVFRKQYFKQFVVYYWCGEFIYTFKLYLKQHMFLSLAGQCTVEGTATTIVACLATVRMYLW
jgi:hypothetical protein